jgi:hypothetical protein
MTAFPRSLLPALAGLLACAAMLLGAPRHAAAEDDGYGQAPYGDRSYGGQSYSPGPAQPYAPGPYDQGSRAERYEQRPPPYRQDRTYSPEEVVAEGHRFFGVLSRELASVIERATRQWGRPNGYVLGEEASGAIIGGLRYGEGTLFTRMGPQRHVFWQGPTIGFDLGGEGARTMMLVYNLPRVDAMFQRFAGINGSAYLVGGFGMTALTANNIVLVPIRTGVGARLGLNIGYLKFTPRATWNPF